VRELREVSAVPTWEVAEVRLGECEAEWGARYPAVNSVWSRGWESFVTFLRFPSQIRRVVHTP